MTQLLRRQLDGLDEHVLNRATRVSVADADAHPRHAERIAAAKRAIEAAQKAVADGAGSEYAHRADRAEVGLALARGDASIDIAVSGPPVAREQTPIEVMRGGSGDRATVSSDDQDTQEAIAGVEFMRKLRANANGEQQ